MALRIKDNVDLKELKKFGFDTIPENEYYRFYRNDDYIWVDKYTRKIDYRYFNLGILTSSNEPQTRVSRTITTKLIKAGLVEKVVEDE